MSNLNLIKLKILDQELTIEEAQKLYEELKLLFDKSRDTYIPYPVYPEYPIDREWPMPPTITYSKVWDDNSSSYINQKVAIF
jgi:hypothetical protein